MAPSDADLSIKSGTIAQVILVSNQIPEFKNPHQADEYEKRLEKANHLILVAFDQEKPVGFKVGYDRDNDGSFYSWMGAILPAYRQLGIAKELAIYQEQWAMKQGFKKIRMKTRNRLKPMLLFAIKNGFDIIAVDTRPSIGENRIILEKLI